MTEEAKLTVLPGKTLFSFGPDGTFKIAPDIRASMVAEFRSMLREAGTDLAQASTDAAVRAALEQAAGVATSFLVGDPRNGVPLRNPMAHEIAARILALRPAPPAPDARVAALVAALRDVSAILQKIAEGGGLVRADTIFRIGLVRLVSVGGALDDANAALAEMEAPHA